MNSRDRWHSTLPEERVNTNDYNWVERSASGIEILAVAIVVLALLAATLQYLAQLGYPP